MAKPGPQKIKRYGLEFKLRAVLMSEQPGVQVKDVAQSLCIHPFMLAFSWVEWPDKATRDAAMKKMIEDPRMNPSIPGSPPMPFDGKRMIFGGFEQVVEVRA